MGANVHLYQIRAGVWRCQKQLKKMRFIKDFKGGTTAAREAAARKWWADILARYSENVEGVKAWQFFKAEWKKWAQTDTPAEPALSARTIYEYGWAFSNAERLISPLRFLDDLTLPKLRQARAILADEARAKGADNYSPNKFVVCMRGAISWAIERGYMRDISLENFRTLPTAPVVVKTQTAREIELLLKYGTAKERVVVLLGFDCGCRPEEIANLLFENLDLENGFADIVPHDADEARGVFKWHPKVWKRRQIRLTPRLIAEIRRLDASKSPYLITNQYGERYSQEGFSHFFQKFVKKINKEIRENEPTPITITTTAKILRKSYSTSRQSEGATLADTAHAMGHASTRVTVKNYTNGIAPEMRAAERERLRKMDAFIVPLNYGGGAQNG